VFLKSEGHVFSGTLTETRGTIRQKQFIIITVS
jgi:hypothetical protein